MTPAIYECALLALTAYCCAKSENMDEILCVACTLRNRVLRYGKTYTQVCEEAMKESSRWNWPSIRNPVLINPYNGLLTAVEGIYRNETPDLTSNHLQKNGAMYFGEVMEHQGTGDWFETTILSNPQDHPLIGRWGSQNFYA